MFNFNTSANESYRITSASCDKKRAQRYQVQSKRTEKSKQIQHFNFDLLTENCLLWKQFIEGEWLYHEQIFGIATNMWNVRGAESRMIKAIRNNSCYGNTVQNKHNTIKSCSVYQYTPSRCQNFCPHYSNCPNSGVNMHHAMNNKRGQIRLVDEYQANTLADTEQSLEEAILTAMQDPDNKVHIIKSPAGTGKTTVLKQLDTMNWLNSVAIAYPNHKLGNDIADRLQIRNAVHVKELVLHNESILTEFKRLQGIGAYMDARKLLKEHEEQLSSEGTEGATQDTITIQEYLSALDNCKSTSNPVLCTHRRMLELNNPNIETYIIDEDIMHSSLIHTQELNPDKLEELINMAIRANAPTTSGQLETIQSTVIEAQDKPGQAFSIDIPFLIKDKEVNRIINQYKERLDVNIVDILKIRIVTANTNREVMGMSMRELPNKKCIILSATANETVYRGLIPNRDIKFTDLGNVETQGRLILHYDSFSRNKLAKNLDTSIQKVKNEAPGIQNVITFVKHKKDFKQAGFQPIAHFGACSGLDAYKGQDLIVAGTPHVDERLYLLVAAAIKNDIVIEQGIEYSNVIRNGYEFYFSTYHAGLVTPTDNLLQEIQFYFIESELIQAVGRARILRTDATVHLFSNCPLPGCELYEPAKIS